MSRTNFTTPLLFLSLFLLGTSACATLFPPRPAITWDTDPEALIVSATYCCGFVLSYEVENYIPDAQIWGDGRIIWVEEGGDQRKVFEGALTQGQMADFLRFIETEGFFGWEDLYANYNITDHAHQCLEIVLLEESKRVCEYIEGAPRAFHYLYNRIAKGAGATGTAFIPDSGYLISYLFPRLYAKRYFNDQIWEADKMGFSLEEAVHGLWIEGEVLETAWEIVNINIWRNLIQDGEDYYEIAIQIPGVSAQAPPER